MYRVSQKNLQGFFLKDWVIFSLTVFEFETTTYIHTILKKIQARQISQNFLLKNGSKKFKQCKENWAIIKISTP